MSRLVKVKLALVDKDHLIANQYVSDASGQWERKLESLSENIRAIGLDRTFERGGVEIAIDDTDEIYQSMMAHDTNRKIANKAVTIYIYKPDGVTIQKTLVTGIVSWNRIDGKFIVKCEQNFAGKLPQTPPAGELKIDVTDWPSSPKISRGKVVAYPAGVIYAKKGGMVCWRVANAPAAKFLITWSDPDFAARVQSVQAVFQGGVKMRTTAYSLVRDAAGWEYLSIPKGRMSLVRANLTANASLFSAGNPVDSLNEGLAALGITLVDAGDSVKTWCTANGWSIIGAPTDFATVLEYVEFWCHNFDCFWWINPAGDINIKHIDWTAVTSEATLGDQHFEEFSEMATMDGFANRIVASLDYNYGISEWGTVLVVDSTAGDYLPATIPIEKIEEYAIGSFSGAVKPMANKLKYIDHPLQTVTGRIKQNLYEQLGLSVCSVITIDHYMQIGGSGKYLILREVEDTISGDIIITAHRLWGA
jgi:hypothetical protein